MSNIPSGRHNPDQIRYYQALSDTIAIFWQYHKERLETGNIPLALTHYPSHPGYEQFSPKRLVQARKKGSIHMTIEYGDAISMTVNASWLQFLELTRRELDNSFLARINIHPPEFSKRFYHPYVVSRIQEAHELSKQHSPVFNAKIYGIESAMTAGIGTGAKTTSHVKALLGTEFTPLIPLILSKVSIYRISEMRDAIGAPYSANMFKGTDNFTLFNDTARHIDMDALRTLGYGDAIGCPAGLPPSEETRAFLESIHSPMQSRTMLEDFTQTVADDFDKTIVPWYERLSPKDRELYLDPRALRLLSGESRASFCPRKEG